MAKRNVQTELLPNGSANVTFEFNLENFGNVDLDQLSLVDDLSAAFPATCEVSVLSLTSDDFIINASYDGTTDTELLALGNDLPVGDKGAVLLTINVINCDDTQTSFINTATAEATSPGGLVITDNSVDGPDPDGTDEDDNPDEESGTPITFTQNPIIGVAKRKVSLTNNPNGSATVTFEIKVENFGDVELLDVQVMEALFTTFPGPCSSTVLSLTSNDFTVNQDFDGLTDVNLLNGTDILSVGDKGAILLTVLVENCGVNNGPFYNTVVATATGPGGTTTSDNSVDGSDPDPDEDGVPSESSPTIIQFDEVPLIGLAKRVSFAQLNADGTIIVNYEFNIENFGTVDVDNIQVVDNLVAAFPASCVVSVMEITSDDFIVNDNFNGIDDLELLLGGDDLPVGDKGAILLSLAITNCGANIGPFYNNASLSGIAPDGQTLTDNSVEGSDPDPDGNGYPDEMSPTVVSFVENPVLGVTKRVSQGPTLDDDGNYVLTYEIRLENFGDVNLEMLAVNDDLAATFAGAESWMVLGIESEEFAVNTDFDGINDINLITDGELLMPGNEGAIYLTVKVAPGNFAGPYLNTATGVSITPLGTMAVDESQDGTDPDPNDNDDPTDDNDPTPVTLNCFVQIVCPAVADTLIVDNDLGWCRAAVNFPEAAIVTCAGAPDSLIEFMLEGVGAEGIALNTWIAGQPSGLMYQVGLTSVSMRASIPGAPNIGYSDTCQFFIHVFDKEDPEILCQDITVPVGDNCNFVLTPDRIDAGTTDNCTAPEDLLYELSLDNVVFVDFLEFGPEDLINSPITVWLRVTDESGNERTCSAEVNLVDDTAPLIVCPEDRIIFAESNLCVGLVPDLNEDLVVDNCFPIDTVYQVPSAGTLFGTADGDSLYVVLTAVDVQGNTDTCSVLLTLKDTIAPVFLNCPAPDIVLTSLPGMCGAFVNFTIPLAGDNCGFPLISQTDDTGLTSGDMFPVGTTILEFTATDYSGNQTICLQKVIINDKALPEPLYNDGCPENIELAMLPGECGAVVTDIGPSFTDNCPDNLSIIYRIEDELGQEVTSGMNNAVGEFLNEGISTIRYRAQDQPLLLITEITHNLQAGVGGTHPVPSFITGVQPNSDFLELTNFGPASLDVSCLGIERLYPGGSETYSIPQGTILSSGEVLTLHFGEGVDYPANRFFNIGTSTNLGAGQSAAYVISHSGTVLDVAVLGGYNPIGQGSLAVVGINDWNGTTSLGTGILRHTLWDKNTAADFKAVEVCNSGSIGSLNNGLSAAPSNGVQTSIQSQLPNMRECSFEVTVSDYEFPQCGAYGDYIEYSNQETADINYGACVESYLTITDAAEIADINLHVQGQSNAFGNLTLSLISPQGTEILLSDFICGANDGFNLELDSDVAASIVLACNELDAGGVFSPLEDLALLNGEVMTGTWILRIGHTGGQNQATATIDSWSLFISSRQPYSSEDVSLSTDPGLCGADYQWVHPLLFDNCANGQILMQLHDADGALFSSSLISMSNWGTMTSRVFPVGVTKVTYILTDDAGLTSECGFIVTVLDDELPNIVCPLDQTIQLNPGACETPLLPALVGTSDNCGVLNLTYEPPLGTALGIGNTTIEVTISDEAGNTASCTYEVTVLDHLPGSTDLACNDEINVSLGPDCQTEIVAEMLLTGTDYHCYDDYEITICTGPEPDAPMIPTSPFVTLNEAGQQLVFKICDTVSGDCCWGYLNVEFQELPVFTCPVDTTISCNGLTSPELLGRPEILSCIPGGPEISYIDEIEEFDDCDDPRVIILRNWTVADGLGNVSTCQQKITIVGFNLADMEFPADLDNIQLPALNCADVLANPELTHPDSTGYPTVNGSTDVFEVNYCTASYLWADEIYNICPGSYEILRTWKIKNTCLPVVPGVNPLEHIQVIKVLDNTGPEIDCPDDLIINTNAYDCYGSLVLPTPQIVDGCSATTYTFNVSGGALSFYNGEYRLNNLALGTHTVTIKAKDECNRRTECSFTITVKDQTEPTAICNEDLHISIGGQGHARVHASDIDEGSNDNCQLDRVEVRRLINRDLETCLSIPDSFSAWADFIDFTCCDVNQTVRIELRVSDIYGNTNTCWQDVLVEDKINPFCEPPHPVAIDCNQLPPNFSPTDTLILQELFGNAIPTDNCPVAFTRELPPISNLDDCGFGTLLRRFQAIDVFGNVSNSTCQQLITIQEIHEYEIKFPKDVAVVNCGELYPDTLEVFEIGCDLLATSMVDDTLSASGNECFKIFRTFEVVNWCEYDGSSPAIQVNRDEDCDGLPGDEDVWVLVRPSGVTYYDRDRDENNDNPAAMSKSSNCDGLTNPTGHWINSIIDIDALRDPNTGEVQQGAEPVPNIRDIASRGFWKYVQHLRVYDDVAPMIIVEPQNTFCGEDNVDCTGEVDLHFAVEENCTPDDLEITVYLDLDADGSFDFNSDDDPQMVQLTGNYPDFVVSGTYTLGEHEFRILVEDGCGNNNSKDVLFEVVDCKAPTPICINGLAIELIPQPSGTDADGDGDEDCAAMTIWANDFIASSVYDCNGQGEANPNNSGGAEILKYSIHRADSVIAGTELPNANQTGLVVTCDDPETLIVRIYSWDNANNPYAVQPDSTLGGPNYAFCETYVEIQDNMDACEGDECNIFSSRISGLIVTELDEPIADVEVALSGQLTLVQETTADGSYDFANLEAGYDYTVTPVLDLDHSNGVTTFDIILITKHILGTQPLNSPYKIIAADANNSKSVSTFDIIKIRKLILNVDTEFESNTSWRFVEAAYEFPNPANPWEEVFPEVINFNDLTFQQFNQDFIGIKIGDVNSSAQPNFYSLDDRTTTGLFAFELEDEQLVAGQEYQLDFRAKNIHEIQGYQLTLSFDADKVTYVGIDEQIMTEAHIGLRYVDQGMITMSWNGETGLMEHLTAEDVLFGLTFRAHSSTRWSEVLGVSSRYTMAEAYNADDQLLEVGLHFNEGPTVVQAFELYQNRPNPFRESTVIGFYLPEAATASLNIQDINGRTVKLIRNDFAKGYNEVVLKSGDLPKGMLYYTLETDKFNATRKMILSTN